jgi:Na+-translocating ferredoxin:NAD+ oxidoreductase subunit B
MEAIYEQLADFLNRLPAGYPRTDSGVELRILHKLFTPQEAQLVLHLTLIDEEARVVAYCAHQPVQQVAHMLADMERKGLISGSHLPGEPDRYSASQFVIGFWEGQLFRLDLEIIELVEEYLPIIQKAGLWNKNPQIRTIPVGEAIPITSDVLPYMQAEAIVRQHNEFAVGPCICREEQELQGKGCGKPLETCLAFDGAAHNLVHAGLRRPITMEEALAILKQAEETGLVLQPANSQNPAFLCACCGDCCGILRYLKLQDRPADLVANPYTVQLDPDTCAGCGACAERCQMDAITLPNGTAQHDPARCIGCGLCVSTCPTGSLELVLKPAGQQPAIPRSTLETYARLGQERDRLFIARMAGQLVKSQVDRLIAPRQR